jgi:acyl dehydratase
MGDDEPTVSRLLEPWSVRARNLPEHSTNAIHTDEGARAAGFDAALVGGVTTYAYLTHPIVVAWGLDWVGCGTAEVRFDHPVSDGDEIVCTPVADDGAVVVSALVGGESKATLRATGDPGPPRPARAGTSLPSRDIVLADRYGADYGVRVGDDLDFYTTEGVVHPAVWPALANAVFAADLVRGPWIHLRSSIRHHGLAPAGAVATVHATVIDRFQRRSGERAIVDVVIEVDGNLVATLEHEAIIALP